MTAKTLRFLLLQTRNGHDPVRQQEVRCFAATLPCAPEQITVFDLLSGAPPRALLDRHDMVLLGGSGEYSATSDGEWLKRAMEGLRLVCQLCKPTFASCWGFQAMARALGGSVIHDLPRAELGTIPMRLTPAGQEDPIFGPLGSTFDAQCGHEDRVDRLPPGAVRLASTERVENQAYRIDGAPIYCTQFHPELTRQTILERVRCYPQYVERIAGVPLEVFETTCRETPGTMQLLPRFIRTVFG